MRYLTFWTLEKNKEKKEKRNIEVSKNFWKLKKRLGHTNKNVPNIKIQLLKSKLKLKAAENLS